MIRTMKMKTNRETMSVILTITALFLGTLQAFGQNFQGLNTLQNIASEGQSAGKYVVNIAFVFTGIISAIELIPAVIKQAKGEGAAKDHISNLGLSIIAAFIILSVIKAIMAFI